MSLSVAGGLGQWDEIISSIAKIGTAYVTSQVQPRATTDQTMANNLAMLRAQQAQQQPQYGQMLQYPATPIMASPLFIPLVGGLALILIATMMGGKR